MKEIYRYYDMIGTLFTHRSYFPKIIRRMAIDAFVKKQANLENPPFTFTYFVTNRCCLKCAHCFYRLESEKELDLLTLEEISKISSSLNNRIGQIVLTGGEPFLREDIKDIAYTFWKMANVGVSTIVTSGYFPDRIKDTLNHILENTNMAVNLQFSLDGPQSHHNSIRGNKNAFSNMIKSLETAGELRKHFGEKRIPFIHFVTTISKKNNNNLSEIVEIGRTFPEIEHSFVFMRGSHKGTFNVKSDLVSDLNPLEDLFLSGEEMEQCFQVLEKLVWNRKDVGFYERLNREVLRLRIQIHKNQTFSETCRSGYWSFILYPNGDFARCEMLKPIGNVRETDGNIPAFLELKKTKDFFNMTKACSCFHECNLAHNVKVDKESLYRIFM